MTNGPQIDKGDSTKVFYRDSSSVTFTCIYNEIRSEYSKYINPERKRFFSQKHSTETYTIENNNGSND